MKLDLAGPRKRPRLVFPFLRTDRGTFARGDRIRLALFWPEMCKMQRTGSCWRASISSGRKASIPVRAGLAKAQGNAAIDLLPKSLARGAKEFFLEDYRIGWPRGAGRSAAHFFAGAAWGFRRLEIFFAPSGVRLRFYRMAIPGGRVCRAISMAAVGAEIVLHEARTSLGGVRFSFASTPPTNAKLPRSPLGKPAGAPSRS